MSRRTGKIKIGHANTLMVKLRVPDYDTGQLVDFPVDLMDAITKISLVLDSSNVVTSAITAGVSLGIGDQFDQKAHKDKAYLAITFGTVAALADMVGEYYEPHLDIYLSNVAGGTHPVACELFPIEVIA